MVGNISKRTESREKKTYKKITTANQVTIKIKILY